EHERLVSLAGDLGVEDKIAFLGEVPEEELPLFYNTADVLALPSIYEGFGFPALEAMACGTPVVASNRTSVPEVVGDGGILIDPTKPEEWAEQISRVLSDTALAQGLKERAIKRAAQFTWEKTAEETLEVYRRINSEQ
ncbi:MAG: glycosyl transferase group 1, partial [Dehalococcoidia bacterium]|nr:glycosyl transferase group 1 [Dehalococcoidia bacterium]